MFVAAALLLIQGVGEMLKLVRNKTDHPEPMEPMDVR
jgi:TRAP-type mannitol/chloroaromatic compound transport system permease small subunit